MGGTNRAPPIIANFCSMNENGEFALVPRMPAAIEKAEPGTKRVLSGMVADTLALARVEDAEAVFKRASDYYSGNGVALDYTMAVKCFRAAAENGYAPAQQWLGISYLSGIGAVVDWVEAVKWFRLADWSEEAEAYEAMLSPEELQHAERRILDFKAVHLVKKEWRPNPRISSDFGALNAPCPKCGGEVREKYAMFRCTKCDLALLKIVAGRQIEAPEVEELIAKKRVGPLDSFRSKNGEIFSAFLKLNAEFKTEFDFGKNHER
jgi:Zn finger protein HypA/HybF involved in hydrogenase expression